MRTDLVIMKKNFVMTNSLSRNYEKNLIKKRKDIVITGKDPYNGAFHCSTLSLRKRDEFIK